MRRANCFAIHATAEVTAGWASHVRQRWRTAVRAGNSLHGRSLPIGATRMSISARGLVLWQCHNLSSISFNRLSLSVLYITASAVQFPANVPSQRQNNYKCRRKNSRKCSKKPPKQLQMPGIFQQMFHPSIKTTTNAGNSLANVPPKS